MTILHKEVIPLNHIFSRRGLVCALLLSVLLSFPAAALFGLSQSESSSNGMAPIAQNMEIQVYRGVPFTGELSAITQNGEPVIFSILSQPEKGTVTLSENSFCYTPSEGKWGQDQFSYTAQDAQGNLSAPAIVKISIVRQKPAVIYRDMSDHSSATSAVRLAEEGIFVGATLNGVSFFEPDRLVSRGEFLAMAMSVAGTTKPDSVSITGFCDDSVIPTWAKGYAAQALQQGVIAGVSTAEGIAFAADTPIQMHEAATVLNRLLQVTDVDIGELYADTPAWATQAVANMASVSILPTAAYGAGEHEITRAEAADMLCAALTLVEQRQR